MKNIIANDQVTDEADVTTGWHAIEFLLWGQDIRLDKPGDRSYKDYVSRVNFNKRKIYLKRVTELLVSDLNWIVEIWDNKKKV